MVRDSIANKKNKNKDSNYDIILRNVLSRQTILAVLFSVTLVLGTSGIGLTSSSPLSLQQQQQPYQEVYAQEFPEEELSTPEEDSTLTENTTTPGVDATLEICGDGIDNDSNGYTDEEEFCISPTPEEPFPTTTPEDGATVTEDGATVPTPTPTPGVDVTGTGQEICGDFTDNDGDDQIDEFDPEGCVPAEEEGAVTGEEASAGVPTDSATPTPDVTPTATPTPEQTSTPTVVVCADATLPNIDGICIDGSEPRTVSSAELVCDDGSHPDANAICVDSSQPKFVSSGVDVALAGSIFPSPTPEASLNLTKLQPEERVVPGSYLVSLKPDEIGRLNEVIETLNTELVAAGGWVAAVYDNLGAFNLRFNGPPADYEHFLGALEANPAVERISKDGISTLEQTQFRQALPTGVNRVDADLSDTKSGDKGGMVNADIAIMDTGVQVNHPDLNVPVALENHCLTFSSLDEANSIPFVGGSFPRYVSVPGCEDDHGHGTYVAGIGSLQRTITLA